MSEFKETFTWSKDIRSEPQTVRGHRALLHSLTILWRNNKIDKSLEGLPVGPQASAILQLANVQQAIVPVNADDTEICEIPLQGRCINPDRYREPKTETTVQGNATSPGNIISGVNLYE